jgi:hypothetical protein
MRARVVARQVAERVLAVPFPIEVEEVIRVLVGEPGGAPRVGIDDPLHHLGAVLLEKRPQLGRQQRDGALHDEVVCFEAPRVGAPGQREGGCQHENEQPHAHDRYA